MKRQTWSTLHQFPDTRTSCFLIFNRDVHFLAITDLWNILHDIHIT